MSSARPQLGACATAYSKDLLYVKTLFARSLVVLSKLMMQQEPRPSCASTFRMALLLLALHDALQVRLDLSCQESVEGSSLLLCQVVLCLGQWQSTKAKPYEPKSESTRLMPWCRHVLADHASCSQKNILLTISCCCLTCFVLPKQPDTACLYVASQSDGWNWLQLGS